MHIGILSRGPKLYSTGRLVEAAELHGHTVEIIDHVYCSLLITDNGGALFMYGNELQLPDVVIPRIGSSVTAIGAATIAHFDLLRIPHLTSVDGLLLARDKMRSLQHLSIHGIKVPKTMFVTNAREAVKVAKQVGEYPVVVKLLESTHGVGVALARNQHQLERTAEAFLRLQHRIIIQEFIEEADGGDLRIFIVEGRVVASMQRKAIPGEFRANMHLGAKASPGEITPEEEEIALRTAALHGLDIAGVDLIRSKRGPLVMEVNASPGLEGIENCTKVDIASAIIKAAIGKIQLLATPI